MQGGQISDHGVKQGLKDARGRSHLQELIRLQIGCNPFTATAILPLNALSPATFEVDGSALVFMASIGDAGKALGGLGGR